jgi:hypothetical protein
MERERRRSAAPQVFADGEQALDVEVVDRKVRRAADRVTRVATCRFIGDP